jgi:hypothetical protein
MSKSEYHFDARAIVAIHFTKERPSRYVWAPAEPAKSSFFGLCKTPAIKEGWLDPTCWSESRYTLDELKEYDYILRNGEIYNKCHITVYLTSKYQVSKTFETETEASAWIEAIKVKAGKIFQVIEH